MGRGGGGGGAWKMTEMGSVLAKEMAGLVSVLYKPRSETKGKRVVADGVELDFGSALSDSV